MAGAVMSLETTLRHLERLVRDSLSLWEISSQAEVRLLNVSENVTYLIEAPCGQKSVLRVHRENYHTRRAIEGELAWLKALDADGVIETAPVYVGQNGKEIQKNYINGLETPRMMTLFHFVEGVPPDETRDMNEGFQELGAIAARCHNHVLSWRKPPGFERLVWDAKAIFGANARWGDWRDAPEVTPKIAQVLERVEKTLCLRLGAFGKAADRYNLIHADMRLANLLVHQGKTRLIDFDDCGWGWFLYDFAAAISFIEDDPRVPTLQEAWVRGYRSVRVMSAEEEGEIKSFVMLRRMALLAWIGSHYEAPEPQKLAPGFAATTARLGQEYLDSFSSSER